MPEFATELNISSGNTRKLYQVKACTGATREDTLEHQLKKQGLITRRWSIKGDSKPGDIFYWVTHVMSRAYDANYMSLYQSSRWHCGICFTEISYVFVYRAKPEYIDEIYGRVRLNLTDDADILLPNTIVSGSECIHLGDKLKGLVRYLCACKYIADLQQIKFRFSRIDAGNIILGYERWERDEIAMPVQWFYFEPGLRKAIGDIQNRVMFQKNVCYPLEADGVGANMYRALAYPRNIGVRQAFEGRDEYMARTTMETDRQTASPLYYIVISRDMAEMLCRGYYGKQCHLRA